MEISTHGKNTKIMLYLFHEDTLFSKGMYQLERLTAARIRRS